MIGDREPASRRISGIRVLHACDLEDGPFVQELHHCLAGHPAIGHVQFGMQDFWSADPCDYDVLHLHWPEKLFQFKEPVEQDLHRIERRLAEWKNTPCAMVATIHNRYPHYRDTAPFRRLYELVYGAVDGVVHMGRASRTEMNAKYPALRGVPSWVIPHPVYSLLPDTLSAEEARAELGISPSAYVCLAFGRLREEREGGLLLKAFLRLRMRNKRLLFICRQVWPESYLSRLARRAVVRLHPSIMFRATYVPDEQIQIYLKCADVLVIPRFETLNSGHVPLGFTFGRVVVGPDTGVVGELLRDTGNPVYEPGNAAGLAEALAAARRGARAGLGERNRRYGAKNWSPSEVARGHAEMYQRCVEIRS